MNTFYINRKEVKINNIKFLEGKLKNIKNVESL